MKQQKIDFVITWVDENDTKWRKEKNKYSGQNKLESSNIVRYRDWDTLKYWFRGVEKFTPWVNHIFLVTSGHYPKWLNLNNSKLTLINHSDYISKEYLPTFNSNVIELQISKIQGLEEKFVYFNDDFFIVNNMEQIDFFKNNKPRDSFIFDSVSIRKGNNFIEHTILNNLEIVSKYFKKSEINKSNLFKIKYGKMLIKNFLLYPWKNITGIYNPHVAIPYLKSEINKILELEKEEIDKTMKNKFRTKEDCSHWLFRYFNLFNGNFEPISLKKYKYYDLKNDNSKIFKNIINKKYKMICLNDSDCDIDYNKVKKEIHEMFETILPIKSTFEK